MKKIKDLDTIVPYTVGLGNIRVNLNHISCFQFPIVLISLQTLNYNFYE